eukprot:gene5558-8928_t
MYSSHTLPPGFLISNYENSSAASTRFHDESAKRTLDSRRYSAAGCRSPRKHGRGTHRERRCGRSGDGWSPWSAKPPSAVYCDNKSRHQHYHH